MVLVSTIGANAQRFALIDMDYIMENISEYKTAEQKIQTQSEKYQKEVEAVQEEAKKLYEAYQKATNLTATQKTQRENAIVDKEKQASELYQKYFGQDGELAKMQEELIQPISDDIYDIVKTIATQKNYSMVLDRASDTAIIFASPSIDISDEVLEQLTKK